MKNKLFLIFGIFLFSLVFISAAPPVTQVQQFTEGYQIEETAHDILKQSQDYQYNFFVYNQSNGVLIDNSSVNCTFTLSNSSGEIVFSQQAEYNSDNHWGLDILGGNFSNVAGYPYGVICQSDSFGGALSGFFEVTASGSSGTNNIIFYVIILILGYVLNLLGFFNRNTTITALGGIVLIFVGLFMIENGIIIFRDNLTLVISYVTLFWGAGSFLWAAIEEIQENL